MPVVNLDINRLCTLIGRKCDADTLVSTITRLGADVEGSDGKTITVEFFPDRPDLLSVEGVARALRTFMDIERGLKSCTVSDSAIEMRVDGSVIPLRGVVSCAEAVNVKLDSESVQGLMQIQEELHWALGRDRKKVAIGVHDSSRLKPPYVYRAAAPDEVGFVPLGMTDEMSLKEILEKHPKGLEYAHLLQGFKRYPLILDSKGSVLSMPPIINGELTKITENTEKIFVEMTGTDRRAVEKTMNILVYAFAENGWDVSAVKVRYPDRTLKTPDLSPEKRTLPSGYANRMLGLRMSPDEVRASLERMGYNAEGKDEFSLEVPAYRSDILHDIDVVEDIAIGFGYENFMPNLPPLSTTGSALPVEGRTKNVRAGMLGLGFTEVVTLMLSNEKVNNEWTGIRGDAIRVKNPISEEHTIIRTHLLPGVLEVLYLNRHRELPLKLFEVGDVLLLDSKAETGAVRKRLLCACMVHQKANFSEAKAVFTSVMRDLAIKGEIESVQHPSFIEGRCAGIKGVGFFGEIHPRVLENFNLEYPAVALEIML